MKRYGILLLIFLLCLTEGFYTKAENETTASIDAIIGRVSHGDSYSELWLEDDSGNYERTYTYDLSSIMKIGNKYHIVFDTSKYTELILPSQIISYECIGEGYSITQIENKYKSERYDVIPYKKIMRNLSDYVGVDVYVEGYAIQDVGSKYFNEWLLADKEGNVYWFTYMPNKDDDEILVEDKLKIWGHVNFDEPYIYQTLLGTKNKVPKLYVDYLEIDEEY